MIYIYIHNYSHLYIGMKCSGSMVQPLPAPGDPWAQEFALSSDSLCRQGVGECWAMEQPWSIRKNTTIDHHIYLHYCWLSHLIPSGNQTWQWKIPVTNGGFNGKIIYKWGISIATFDFRRVSLYYVDRFKPQSDLILQWLVISPDRGKCWPLPRFWTDGPWSAATRSWLGNGVLWLQPSAAQSSQALCYMHVLGFLKEARHRFLEMLPSNWFMLKRE